MRWVFLGILLLISLLLESTMTTIPLVFVVLLVAAVSFNTTGILAWSFFGGLLLDTLTFQTLGMSSVYFVALVSLVFLYERKFEIRSIPFVLIFSFLGSFIYCLVFRYQYTVLEALISSSFSLMLFLLFQKLPQKQ